MVKRRVEKVSQTRIADLDNLKPRLHQRNMCTCVLDEGTSADTGVGAAIAAGSQLEYVALV